MNTVITVLGLLTAIIVSGYAARLVKLPLPLVQIALGAVIALSAVSREGLPETLRLLRRQIDSFADEDVERLAEEDASRFGHRMSEEDWRR